MKCDSECFFWPAVVVLTIFCAGTPDLLDAIIHWLMK